MATIQLYRDVEFSRDYSNVIAVNKYWGYLNTRKMANRIDIPDLSPTSEMDVDISPEILSDPPYTPICKPNYAIVNPPKFLATAYFITDVEPLTPGAYRLHLVRDVWGSCAIAFGNETEPTNPVMASASLTRSHWLTNSTARTTAPEIPDAASLSITPISTGLRVLAFYFGVAEGETAERAFMLLDRTQPTSVSALWNSIYAMSRVYAFGNVSGAVLQQLILLPETLCAQIPAGTLHSVSASTYDYSGEQTRNVYYSPGFPSVQRKITISSGYGTATPRTVRYVGNWSSCVKLDQRREDHTVILTLSTYSDAGAVSVTMNVDGTEQDLTASLTMPIPTSSANAKEFQRKISDTISLASGGIAALGSIATGNPLGIASSAVGIASTIGGMVARRDGLSLKPGGVLENLIGSGGGVFVISYGNNNAPAESEELRLYGFTGYQNVTGATLPLIAGDTTTPCLYLEGSLTFTESGATPSTSFSGEMAQLLKERARNGIRIWLNGYEDIAI